MKKPKPKTTDAEFIPNVPGAQPDAMKKARQKATDTEFIADVPGVQLITVGIDRETHKRLRLLSVERRVTMAQLVRDSIDAWLPGEIEKSKRSK